MGTQQALTTEQVELLILIDSIEEFESKNPGNIPPGGIKEILDSSNVMEPEKFSQLANVLEHYGYLHNGDKLTIDGKQYIELYKEYLSQKAETPSVQHNSYSLINIGKLDSNLEISFGKISILGKVGSLSELLKKVIQIGK